MPHFPALDIGRFELSIGRLRKLRSEIDNGKRDHEILDRNLPETAERFSEVTWSVNVGSDMLDQRQAMHLHAHSHARAINRFKGYAGMRGIKIELTRQLVRKVNDSQRMGAKPHMAHGGIDGRR